MHRNDEIRKLSLAMSNNWLKQEFLITAHTRKFDRDKNKCLVLMCLPTRYSPPHQIEK